MVENDGDQNDTSKEGHYNNSRQSNQFQIPVVFVLIAVSQRIDCQHCPTVEDGEENDCSNDESSFIIRMAIVNVGEGQRVSLIIVQSIWSEIFMSIDRS